MNSMCEWQEQYLTLFLSQFVSSTELTCNVLRQTDDGVFDDFLKILQNLLEDHTNVAEHFRKF